MILAVIMIIILLMAIMFMFDLHSIIRAKIKMETAEQSAALTAAKWQQESLNLIGEVNLIKACNVLISDIPPLGGNNAEDLQASCASLTEIQSRISFAGPLIAFGAAQQAAKNNGVNIYDNAESNGFKGVDSDMQNYLDKLSIDLRYQPPAAPEYVNHYRWRDPYINMLNYIKSQGMAVRANGRFPGLESVTPRWLTSEYVYWAILNQTWCQPTLNALVKYPDSYWSGKWWDVDYKNTNFPEESEIYTLGLEYRGGDANKSDTYDPAEQTIKTLASDRGMNALSSWNDLTNITWCVYDSKWYPSDYSINPNYSGPDVSSESYWRGDRFLRNNLKNSVVYGGAIAYAECYEKVNTINQYSVNMASPKIGSDITSAADQWEKSKYALKSNIIRKSGSTETKVGNDILRDGQPGGAVAKPIGALSDGQPPPAVAIVLPVFTSAAIIPSTMQEYRPLRMEFSLLEKFLIWLSGVDDLENPATPPPVGTEIYLAALQKLNNEEFRKSGYNNDYATSVVTNDGDYFSDAYKYSSSNPTGAGWLQQIYVASVTPGTGGTGFGITTKQIGYNTAYFQGDKYILRDRNGKLVTNEQMICRWTPGGSGGSAPGTRTGPPRF